MCSALVFRVLKCGLYNFDMVRVTETESLYDPAPTVCLVSIATERQVETTAS